MGAQSSKSKNKLARYPSGAETAWGAQSAQSGGSGSGANAVDVYGDPLDRVLSAPPAAAVRAATMRGDTLTIPTTTGTRLHFCVCKWKQIELFIGDVWETSLLNVHMVEERGTARVDLMIIEELRSLASIDRRVFDEHRESFFALCGKAAVMHHAVLADDVDIMRCDFCDVPRCRETLLAPCFVTGKYHVPGDFAAVQDLENVNEDEHEWRSATVLPPGAVQEASLDLESLADDARTDEDGGCPTHRSFSSRTSSHAMQMPLPSSTVPMPLSSLFPREPQYDPQSGGPPTPSSGAGTPRASLTNASFYTGSTSETREHYTWECPSCMFLNSARKLNTTCGSCGGPQPRRRRGSLANGSQGCATPRGSAAVSVHAMPWSAGTHSMGGASGVPAMLPLDMGVMSVGSAIGSETSSPVTRTRSNSLQQQKHCITCKKMQNNTVFMPCRHIVCCSACAPTHQRCPQCSAVVTHRLEIFV